MSIRISIARISDANSIADMSRRLIEDGLPWSWTDARVVRCINNSECAVLVAKDGRRMAGFAIMEFYDEHAHLNLLAVRPQYRRRGVGRQLVEWLEASARVAGTFDIRLELRAGNDSARQFYERLGYQAVGRKRDYYAGVEDALRMTRNLSLVSAPRA